MMIFTIDLSRSKYKWIFTFDFDSVSSLKNETQSHKWIFEFNFSCEKTREKHKLYRQNRRE